MLAGSCLLAALLAPGRGWSVSEQEFHVQTTADLVELCASKPSDPLYTAATNFCQGFVVGAYQYHAVAAKAENRRPLFCLPNPQPTRSEGIAGFVKWSQAHPAVLPKPPVEGMFEFLAEAYPCHKG